MRVDDSDGDLIAVFVVVRVDNSVDVAFADAVAVQHDVTVGFGHRVPVSQTIGSVYELALA